MNTNFRGEPIQKDTEQSVRIPTVESYHKALARATLAEKRCAELLAALKAAINYPNAADMEKIERLIAKVEGSANR